MVLTGGIGRIAWSNDPTTFGARPDDGDKEVTTFAFPRGDDHFSSLREEARVSASSMSPLSDPSS
jgi:hypothetical protein